MPMLKTKQVVAATATVAAMTLTLAGCSSSDEPTPVESAADMSTAPESTEPLPSESAIVAAGAAADACAAYFELDLLNSSYAGGAVADGDITEEQAKDQFKALLKEMAVQSRAALQDGSGDAKMVNNSKRMRKIVLGLNKNEALSDLPQAKQDRFATSSLRMQRACDRAGYPLPDDNTTARTAAGL